MNSKVFFPITIIGLLLLVVNVGSAGSDGEYCYDQDMEGYICFDTLKKCENEQMDDLLAESSCSNEDRE